MTISSEKVETPIFTPDPVADAVADFKAGKPVVVLDAIDRENEGDLIMAAEHATKEWLAFFIRYTSGYLCAPMTAQRAIDLDLPLMVPRTQDSLRTAYTISVDAADKVSTGISAADRALTLTVLADPDRGPADLIRPGHILPLRALDGGVRVRPGHTEATVDLCQLADLQPVGVIGELVCDNGDMQRGPDCRAFADKHSLKLITIEDLVAYLEANPDQALPAGIEATVKGAEPKPTVTIKRVAEASLPTEQGRFTAHSYTDGCGYDYIALTMGEIDSEERVLTRVHSECLTGDALRSVKCDCGPQLQSAMGAVAERGRGLVLYVRGHEGRGIGLPAKIAAYSLQDRGYDTVEANEHLGLPADARTYDAAVAVLDDLGITSVELLTNNPAKVEALQNAGLDVTRTPTLVARCSDNTKYLDIKETKMGHMIDSSLTKTATGEQQ